MRLPLCDVALLSTRRATRCRPFAQHIDFAELAALLDGLLARGDAGKGGRAPPPHLSDGARVGLEMHVQALGRADGVPAAGPHELPAIGLLEGAKRLATCYTRA